MVKVSFRKLFMKEGDGKFLNFPFHLAVVLLHVYDSDIVVDKASKISQKRRTSHGRYANFGEAEAEILAAQETNSPVKYK